MPNLVLWAAFVMAYCVLERLGMPRPFALGGIPVSDLAGGLALALLARQGPALFLLVVAADILSKLLDPGLRPPPAAIVCSALALGGIYAFAAVWLRRLAVEALTNQRDLFRLILICALASLARAAADVVVLRVFGGGTTDGFLQALARGGSGDFIGLMMVTPLAASLASAKTRPSGRAVAEFLLQLSALGVVFTLVVTTEDADPFRLFYLLFLPLIWIAARFGAPGAAMGNLAVQLSLIGLFLARPEARESLLNYDVRLAATLLCALVLGVAVSERRNAETILRQRQEELARVSRLTLAGEMAAALAHELNQPLLAAIAFTRAAQRFMGLKDGAADAAQAMDEAVAQAERAGAIVRTLRSFVGKGAVERKPADPAALARDATALAEAECARLGIRVVIAIDRALPSVLVDAVQIQQVLLNLVRNAMDALDHPRLSAKVILISARRASDREVELEVRDTGPGVSPAAAGRLFEPFASEKESGMGLGLVICRGIVEAHGGRLWLETNQPGRCVFRFSLPIARSEHKVTL
jgi:signal transduction histidine kinase